MEIFFFILGSIVFYSLGLIIGISIKTKLGQSYLKTEDKEDSTKEEKADKRYLSFYS